MTALENYLEAAREAGCPPDQMANFTRAGVVIQPRQLLASAAARLCDRRCGRCEELAWAGDDLPDACADCGPTEVGYGGARGGGKSHWSIAQVGADDCQRYPGLKALLLRKVGKSNREAFDDLRRKVLPNLGGFFNKGSGILEFPNGSRIHLGNFQNESDIDKYLGLEYDLIAIEEATQLSAEKHRLIRGSLRSSKPGWRPRVYSTTNPGGVGHGHYKETFILPFRAGKEVRTRFIPATVRDNRFNNAEYRGSLKGQVGWRRAAWLEGDWDVMAGQFFTNWRHDTHVIPACSVPEGWDCWLGFDYGFQHYTYVVLMAEGPDRVLYAIAEHCERRWTPERHARGIRAMLDRCGVAERRLRGIYAGRDCFNADEYGKSIADKYAAEKLRLTPADVDRINGAAEILDLLGDAEADPVIPPRLYVSEACPRLVATMPDLTHDPDRNEDVLKIDADEDGKGGDDAYDGLRYGVMRNGRRRRGRAAAGPQPERHKVA